MAKKEKEDNEGIRAVVVVFTKEGFEKCVKGLYITKACHGDLFLDADKAMSKIVTAVGRKNKIVVI